MFLFCKEFLNMHTNSLFLNFIISETDLVYDTRDTKISRVFFFLKKKEGKKSKHFWEELSYIYLYIQEEDFIYEGKTKKPLKTKHRHCPCRVIIIIFFLIALGMFIFTWWKHRVFLLWKPWWLSTLRARSKSVWVELLWTVQWLRLVMEATAATNIREYEKEKGEWGLWYTSKKPHSAFITVICDKAQLFITVIYHSYMWLNDNGHWKLFLGLCESS